MNRAQFSPLAYITLKMAEIEEAAAEFKRRAEAAEAELAELKSKEK